VTQSDPPAFNGVQDNHEARFLREALAQAIQREAAETAFWTGRARFSGAVIDAIGRVERHVFIPERLPLRLAYANHPQPIGLGQTISQPYIVALMTDLLDLTGGQRVLEVGTGSGYQAAVLAELGVEVYSVERLHTLADHARAVLACQGYENVHVRCADGTEGWAKHAPFAGILVAAAAQNSIPQALIDQLAPGGRMIIPIGAQLGPQMLTLGVKDARGHFVSHPVLPVAFVPLLSSLENKEKAR